MKIAGALAALLEVVDQDSKARCTKILGDAQTEAQTLCSAALRDGRERLRAALRAERAGAAVRVAAARAQLETEQRRARQRQASLAIAAAEALLPAALLAAWKNPSRRRQWLALALARGARSLPCDGWHIRLAPDVDANDKAWLLQRCNELGVARTRIEEDGSINAGMEIRAGGARLEATPAGLLADHAWVYGRLLQILEDASAGQPRGEIANPPQAQSGATTSPPASGQRAGKEVAP